ncbi:hypothetical protein [Mucilaginibacter gotjawali]|uniref:Uncharacterized protein n=2 Tax=Mucilaginibacter gotjawali TaxID=1550579 RepID=A0A839SAA4_9SPHI|nr:hypothetical protein [Mucilaginibacter gotjawali]MBB3053890.1 hypothetical protein [Mucilaginibacter gotjawali]BAU54154.1 hypothetical protein MgSA37_02326 [Mucilaginibacter gotjawali]
MIAQTKNSDWDELSLKIVTGVNKALRKMAEKSAANDGNLVISDGKGNVQSVPAKDVLKNLPK